MLNPYHELKAPVRYGIGLGAALLVLLVWSALSGFEIVGPRKLPAPWEVVSAFGQLLAYNEAKESYLLLDATIASVSRIAFAALVTLVIGLPVGILMGASPHVNAAIGFLLDPFRSAPIVTVLPILVMWIGIGESLKVVFLFLGAVVYLIPMTRDAILAVPRETHVLLKDLGGSDLEAIRLGVLPMAMPRIWDGITVSVSVMWTYITVAEYVNAESGLGAMIQNSKRFSAMDQVFAGIIVIIALAMITNQTLVFLKGRLFPWATE